MSLNPSLYATLSESAEPTQVAAQYVWGARPGHRDELVRRDRDADGDGTLDERLYCLMDYFNPTAIVDETGTVVERYGWSAFGARTVLDADWEERSPSAFAFEFGFHGQFLDDETVYYNYGYRYYSPEIGRWLSRDPIGERGGANLFAYTENHSVNAVDYLGLDSSGGVANQNVSKRVLMLIGPNTGAPGDDKQPASHPIFAGIREQLGISNGGDGRTFRRITSHDFIYQDSGLQQLGFQHWVNRYKSEWEQTSGARCCVDYDASVVTGAPKDPLTPKKLQANLSHPEIQKTDKIFFLVHNATERGELLLGAGTSGHPNATDSILDWATNFTPHEIFYGLPFPLTVDIYTCNCGFFEGITSVGGTPSGALISINFIGNNEGISVWRDFKDLYLKEWVGSECEANKQPL